MPDPGESVFARMDISYNWIHDDTYVISKIQYESAGFLGIGVISIWDWHSHKVPLPVWTADIPSFWHEKTYHPRLHRILYGGDTFEGISVHAFDVMNIYIMGWAGINFSIGPSIPPPFFETSSACIQPDFTEVPDLPIETQSWVLACLYSAGDIRAYDPQGRITGLVGGEVKEEIPNSMYDEESETVIIFSASDTYRYEAVGTEEGTYGLTVTYVKDREATTFTATDIPTTPQALDQYDIDWEALSQGKEGVTVQVDTDGDSTFERTITSDGELTQDEYLFVTSVNPEGKLPATWSEVKRTQLFQNYPNPFNPDTWIPYTLAEQNRVVIKIHAATGELVRTLDLGSKPVGIYFSKDKAAYWDGYDDAGGPVASGVYFYTFEAGGFSQIRKMTVLR